MVKGMHVTRDFCASQSYKGGRETAHVDMRPPAYKMAGPDGTGARVYRQAPLSARAESVPFPVHNYACFYGKTCFNCVSRQENSLYLTARSTCGTVSAARGSVPAMCSRKTTRRSRVCVILKTDIVAVSGKCVKRCERFPRPMSWVKYLVIPLSETILATCHG